LLEGTRAFGLKLTENFTYFKQRIRSTHSAMLRAGFAQDRLYNRILPSSTSPIQLALSFKLTEFLPLRHKTQDQRQKTQDTRLKTQYGIS